MYFGYRFEVPPLQITKPYQKIALSPQYFPLRSIKKDQEERTKLSYFKLLEAKKQLYTSQDDNAIQRVRTYYGRLQDRQLYSQYKETIKPNYNLQKYRFSLAHEKASNYFNQNQNNDIPQQETIKFQPQQITRDEQQLNEENELKNKNYQQQQYLDNFYRELYDQLDENIIKYQDHD